MSKAIKGAEKVLKTLNDAGAEIIPPSIAINAGMYYQKQVNGKLALIYEANLTARPLVAINFKREFDLVDLMRKGVEGIKGAFHPKDKKTKDKFTKAKKNNSKIIEYFDSIKKDLKIKGSFDATGELILEQNIKFNFLTNSHSFIDKVGNLVQTAQNEITIRDEVKFTANVTGHYKREFDFFRLQTKVEGNIDLNLKGGSGMKIQYGVDNGGGKSGSAKGLYFIPSIFCSGIEGNYFGSLKISNVLTEILDIDEFSTNKGLPTPFVLVEPFEVPLFAIQLFKQK